MTQLILAKERIARDGKGNIQARNRQIDRQLKQVKEKQKKFEQEILRKDIRKKQLVYESKYLYDKMKVEELIQNADNVFTEGVIDRVRKEKMRTEFGKKLKQDFLNAIKGVRHRTQFIMALKVVRTIRENMFSDIANLTKDSAKEMFLDADTNEGVQKKDRKGFMELVEDAIANTLPSGPRSEPMPGFQIRLRF